MAGTLRDGPGEDTHFYRWSTMLFPDLPRITTATTTGTFHHP